MQYVEYGQQHSDVIILLHGGGLSWWNYKEVAELLQHKYHVVLPILNGHAGSDTDFTTIEENASEIIKFIEERFNGTVLLLGGVSLGGQILLEVLSQRADICQYAIIESALVIPSKFIYFLIKPVFGRCYGLIRHKWFSEFQFKSLRIKQTLFEEYFRDTCCITKENMIAFLQANSVYSLKDSIQDCCAKVYVFVGEKENHAMRKSIKRIQEKIQGSVVQVLPNLYHGEFSINHPDDYAKKVLELVKRN